MCLISRCLPDPQAFKSIRVPFFIKAELKSADKNRTVEGIVDVSQAVLKVFFLCDSNTPAAKGPCV